MSGYAASARLRGGSTRFVPVAGSRARTATGVVYAGPPVGGNLADRDWSELAEPPLRERLAARWGNLRETWSQMTFFLFDPESWR